MARRMASSMSCAALRTLRGAKAWGADIWLLLQIGGALKGVIRFFQIEITIDMFVRDTWPFL